MNFASSNLLEQCISYIDTRFQTIFSHGDNSIQLALVMLIAQIAFIILFGIFTEYDRENLSDEELTRMYPWFQE